MFSVPTISTLSNSIEAAIAERPAVRIRTYNLRRSDKVGLTNYLRHEHGIRGATVSIGYRSVIVYFSNKTDLHKVIDAVGKYSQDSEHYTVSKSRRFSVKRFVQALKR